MVVTEEDARLYIELLREKRLCRMFIDSILHQNAVIDRVDKTDKTAKERKGISDLQELLERMIKLMKEGEKVQSLMTHLQFHIDLVYLLQTVEVEHTFTKPLVKLVIRSLILFCRNYYPNQVLMVPYIKQVLALRKHGFKVSKLLYQIFKSGESPEGEKQTVHHLLDELKDPETSLNPDSLRLLAALISTSSDKRSKHVAKSLLALGVKRYLLMGREEFERKDAFVCKWRRDRRSAAGAEVKAHVYVIAAIGNCALRCEYGRIQGSKLIPENCIIDNLINENTPYLLKGVYLQLYYCLYIHGGANAKKVREPPKLFASVLKTILRDTEKSYQYEFALDLLYKKRRAVFKAHEDNKSSRSSEYELNEGHVVNWDQKREKDTEFLHSPSEYWKMLYTTGKIESDKSGLLNFLHETFSLHVWRLNEDTFTLVSNIRSTLMGLVDYLYKVCEDKDLELDELLCTICSTLEALPTSRKPAGKNSQVRIDTQPEESKLERSKSNDAASDTHRHLRQPSEDEQDSNENSETSVCREKDSCTLVISTLKSHIVESNCTIREAFKLFSSNVDRRVERLELKKAIKDTCGNQVAYQQVEEAVNHIERTTGVPETLLFAEFNKMLKKALKKDQYKNYKQKVVDVADVRLEEDAVSSSKKVNVCLKNFIADYRSCIEYFPDDEDLAELASKVHAIVFILCY